MNIDTEIFSFIVCFYFLIIPLIYNAMWQGNKTSFVKWYFIKSKRVNWLGYFIFFILGLGCSIWLIIIYFCELLFYVIFLPFCWLFEFLFLNKDCSNLNKN